MTNFSDYMNTQSKIELNDLGLNETYALRAVTFHIGESINNGHYIGNLVKFVKINFLRFFNEIVH